MCKNIKNYFITKLSSTHVTEPPKQFVSRLRVEHAAAILVTSDKSILDVALEVGFASHEVFVRAFRRKIACSPGEYRKSGLILASDADKNKHADLVQSIGPCTKLFYCNTNARSKRPMSTSKIVCKVLENAQPIVYLSTRAARMEFASVFPDCIGRVFTHAMAKGLAIAGHPIARYADTGPGLWTIEFIVPLAQPAGEDAVTGEFKVGALYKGPVAFAENIGPYEELPTTNAAIEKWIEENGYQVAGAPWEYYATDPGEVPNPAEWVTEVYWPISQ